ncbi:MAG: hypothetical protein HY300_14080 [Verrucomicrobia bacterium]|nr:hypothetical protein [Verrucomicrobiota bacterium]
MDEPDTKTPWWKQPVCPPGNKWWNRRLRFFPSFRPDIGEAVETNLGLQFLAVSFATMILDGGAMFQTVALPAVAYWLVVLMALVRRGISTTRVDDFFLKAGFIVFFFTIAFTSPWWGWLRRLIKWN